VPIEPGWCAPRSASIDGAARQDVAVARFAKRGIPYYALHEPHFRDWVGKAVTYWQQLRAAESAPG
jgi:hypothetical protein